MSINDYNGFKCFDTLNLLMEMLFDFKNQYLLLRLIWTSFHCNNLILFTNLYVSSQVEYEENRDVMLALNNSQQRNFGVDQNMFTTRQVLSE